MRRMAVALLVVGLAAGCGVRLPGPVGPVAPLPEHRLTLRFASQVPAVYYVLSGPAESYRRFRVNDRLRGALEEYARKKSAAGAPEDADLTVELLGVTTDYQQIGAGLGRPRVVPVFLDLDGDFSVPAEITKRVTLSIRVGIRAGGKTVRSETARAEATEVIDRDHFDRWAYDYSDVMEAAIRKAVEVVDRMVDEALARMAMP